VLPPERSPTLSRVYAPFVATALLLATAAGFLSGIGLAANRLLAEPWASSSALLEVHQLAQTWGFIGLFTIGMSFRLMPLWTRSSLRPSCLVPAVWLAVVTAMLLNILATIWAPSGFETTAEPVVKTALLVASLAFLIIVASTLRKRAGVAHRPPWAFLAGALLLLLSAVLCLAVELSDSYRFWIRSATQLAFLGGFMPAFVTSAAARGFRPGAWREGTFALILGLTMALLIAALLYLDVGGQGETAVRLAGLAFAAIGAVWLSAGYLSGVFDATASRPGTSSWPHLALIRSAFLWIMISGMIGLWVGFRALLANDVPASAHLDAIVHGLGMSALVLILGMGLLLLPEFARRPLRSRSSTLLASGLLVALNGSAILRVVTPLAGSTIDASWLAGMQALAGVLSEFALLAFVVAFASGRRPYRGSGGVPVPTTTPPDRGTHGLDQLC
jgi:hypothetical protein